MSSTGSARHLGNYTNVTLRIVLALAALAVLGAMVWQGVTSSGNPDPTATHLSREAVILNTGIIVFREGLEAILILAALSASLVKSNQSYRRPLFAGAGLAFLASIATWFIVIAILDSVNAPALHIQAATGLLAIVVLLIIMNWFFHKVYWTGWITMHNKRGREILANAGQEGRSVTWKGMALLGLTAMYREGFEVVLFLQSMRLRAGSNVVLQGVLIGLAFTAVVGILTFAAERRLPYKKMLIFTGLMLSGVLVVMVGESVQELQLANWISTTPLNLNIPGWMGMWFAIFPNVEGISAQIAAGVFVIGSYFLSQYLKVWRPRKRGESLAFRSETVAAEG